MGTKLINGNTLVFKVSQSGKINDLNLDGEAVNFIADMLEVNSEVISLIKNNLIKFGKSIYEKKGSFVIVSKISFDENLNIVPTLQEAFDFIEMEEIERDLGI